MTFRQACIAVKTKECLAVAMKENSKEIFILEYNDDLNRFSKSILYYSQDEGDFCGTEDLFSPEEFIKVFPDYNELDFREMRVEGIIALNEIWEYAIDTIVQNIL